MIVLSETALGQNDNEKSQFRQKLNALWKDKRPYKKRLLAAAASAFSLCFTLIFFGPVEITAFSYDSLNFDVLAITPIMAVAAVAVFLVLSLLISALRGKIFNYAVSFIFAITISGYIQGNFLNGNLGALTGDPIDWHNQTRKMIINLIIWFVISLVPFIILYFNKKNWYNVVTFGSILLVIMQSVALFQVYTIEKPKNYGYYLSADGIFDYSSKKNTLVFLLDRLDYEFIEEVLKDDPSFFDDMDGFTSYTNAISEHARTKPAANFILTACEEYAYQIPAEEYFDKSWTAGGRNILGDLKEAGYKINIYSEMGNMFGSGETAEKYVSNIFSIDNSKETIEKDVTNNKLNVPEVFRNLFYLSTYRYAPTAIKPFFWSYTGTINNSTYLNSSVYEIDETKYAEGIKKFNVDDEYGYFKFYHFNGSHPPYSVKEDGSKSTELTSSLEQTKGNFEILFKAFNKMKKLGIYKDTGIIITADHGSAISDDEPLQKATRIGLFYKPPGSEEMSLKTSKAPVSLKNLPATILKSSGLDYTDYGRPLDEVKEDEKITRTFYKAVMKDGREDKLYIYEVEGDASDFNNWKNINVVPIEHSFY